MQVYDLENLRLGQTWMVKPHFQSNGVIHSIFNTLSSESKVDHVAHGLQGYFQACMELQCIRIVNIRACHW